MTVPRTVMFPSGTGLKAIRARWPGLCQVFADGGYSRPKLTGAMSGFGDWTLEIIKRCDTAKGFEVLPRTCIAERTFASLGRSRRLAVDWEKSIASTEARIFVAQIRLPTRRLARYCDVS